MLYFITPPRNVSQCEARSPTQSAYKPDIDGCAEDQDVPRVQYRRTPRCELHMI